jgi:hypothetical protein
MTATVCDIVVPFIPVIKFVAVRELFPDIKFVEACSDVIVHTGRTRPRYYSLKKRRKKYGCQLANELPIDNRKFYGSRKLKNG